MAIKTRISDRFGSGPTAVPFNPSMTRWACATCGSHFGHAPAGVTPTVTELRGCDMTCGYGSEGHAPALVPATPWKVEECRGRWVGDDKPFYLMIEYEGRVLETRERNFHDDSDFYAVVWTGDRITTVEYATTRYATDDNSADRDATPETLAAAAAWAAELAADRAVEERRDELERAAIEVKTFGAEVRVVKGRKIPKGTTGEVVRWVEGTNFSGSRWSYPPWRVMVRRTDGTTFWITDTNLERVTPGSTEFDAESLRAEILGRALKVSPSGLYRAMTGPAAGITAVL